MFCFYTLIFMPTKICKVVFHLRLKNQVKMIQKLSYMALMLVRKCKFVSVVPSESRLHAQEDIRGPLSELQQQVLPDIHYQIQDYRYIT